MLVTEYFNKLQQIILRYHYQDLNSPKRIFRYDNAKHHPALITFPHHKHIGPETEPDNVTEAPEMSLEEVLREIERYVITNM